MLQEVVAPDEVKRYVHAVREQLADGRLDAPAADAARAIAAPPTAAPADAMLAALPRPEQLEPSSGGGGADVPFLARDPATSLLQSALAEHYGAAGAITERPAEGPLEHLLHVVERIARDIFHDERMGPLDPEWVTQIAASMLTRLAKGNHPFNHAPAEYETTAPDPRIVVVGDWGSGLPRARAVAALMAARVEEALAAGRTVSVIHLGDVYYSGTRAEYDANVLAPGLWPVTTEQAAGGVTSWALNGNHDMYSGGWSYFDHQLADRRFAAQRSPDGKPTSFFRLRTPRWDLVGLDTSWDRDVLSSGEVGVLEDPQATWVARWAADARASGRALMLLSHHQFLSVLDPGDLGPTLEAKLGPVLAAGAVRAWLWGHEHRCLGYSEQGGIAYARCIGHGGVPVRPYPSGKPLPEGVTFMERGVDHDDDGDWARFGFAVLDFAADGAIAVSYFDDHGEASPPPETFTTAR